MGLSGYFFVWERHISIQMLGCLSIHSTYVRLSEHCFHSIICIHEWISFKFVYAFVPTMSRLGLLLGKFQYFTTEFGHLSVYIKWCLASSSFNIGR